MSGYKVVPVEPTTEMMEEGLAGWNGNDLSETDLDDMWRRMLDAAPTVQGEPQPAPSAPTPTFQLGDHVRKTKGSQWKGRVVGTYSTSLTPEGYAVESDTEKGSVQIYPVGALELVGEQPPC